MPRRSLCDVMLLHIFWPWLRASSFLLNQGPMFVFSYYLYFEILRRVAPSDGVAPFWHACIMRCAVQPLLPTTRLQALYPLTDTHISPCKYHCSHSASSHNTIFVYIVYRPGFGIISTWSDLVDWSRGEVVGLEAQTYLSIAWHAGEEHPACSFRPCRTCYVAIQTGSTECVTTSLFRYRVTIGF